MGVDGEAFEQPAFMVDTCHRWLWVRRASELEPLFLIKISKVLNTSGADVATGAFGPRGKKPTWINHNFYVIF